MAGGVQMSQMPISHLVGSASDLLRFHTARAAVVPFAVGALDWYDPSLFHWF